MACNMAILLHFCLQEHNKQAQACCKGAFPALANHCHCTGCVSAGQQPSGTAPHPSPTVGPTLLNGSTLPTAPLASLPINFRSSPNASETVVPPQAIAALAPGPSANAVAAQPPEASAPGLLPAGSATAPALPPSQNLTLLNTPLRELPVSFNSGVNPVGR